MIQVIVIGPPRSGTSVVARLLQENLGVMMDEGPIEKDERNPMGYYEDHRITQINDEANIRGLKRQQIDKSYVPGKKMDLLWASQFAKWVTYRSMKYKRWGFKDPLIIGIIHHVRQFFQNPIWIVTDRKDEQILKSQVDKLGLSLNDAYEGLKAYRLLIAKHLDNPNVIDMSNHQAEDKLTKHLEGILWR